MAPNLSGRDCRKRLGPRLEDDWEKKLREIRGNAERRRGIQDTEEAIRSHFHKLNEEGMPAEVMRISLKCPNSMKRMEDAARGANCTHLKCFDLGTFLKMVEQTPVWNCTFCGNEVKSDNIIIDEYFNAILGDVKTKTVEQVDLLPDGNWKLLDEDRLLPSTTESFGGSDEELQIAVDSATLPVSVVNRIIRATSTCYVEQHNPAKRKRLEPVADELSVRIKDEIIQTCKSHQTASGVATHGGADDNVVAEAMPADSAANEVNDLHGKLDTLNQEGRAQTASQALIRQTFHNEVNAVCQSRDALSVELQAEKAAHTSIVSGTVIFAQKVAHLPQMDVLKETTSASAELEIQLAKANSQIVRLETVLADKDAKYENLAHTYRRARHISVESLELNVANKSQEIEPQTQQDYEVPGNSDAFEENDMLPQEWKDYVATTFEALQDLRIKKDGELTEADHAVIEATLPPSLTAVNMNYKGLYVNETQLACPHCYTILSKSSWTGHVKTHYKPFACRKCKKRRGKKDHFYFHLKAIKDGADVKRLLCYGCYRDVIGSCKKGCRDKYEAQLKQKGRTEFSYQHLCLRCRNELKA
ncbi:MIZ zinc finger family protein [Aphelenchoides avenae]|nr:MIZ zinc finger family protein [Aphelenchus avenae]